MWRWPVPATSRISWPSTPAGSSTAAPRRRWKRPHESCGATTRAEWPWWLAAALLAAGGAVLLYDAGRDLLAAPAFDGVLRLVIEAIAVAVAVGFCLRR